MYYLLYCALVHTYIYLHIHFRSYRGLIRFIIYIYIYNSNSNFVIDAKMPDSVVFYSILRFMSLDLSF